MKRVFRSKVEGSKANAVRCRCSAVGVVLFFLFTVYSALPVHAQSTEFTYQGRLLDSNLPPTALYDFEFSLWDSLENGTQTGATRSVNGVSITNGIFTVRLDFGSEFDGSARFLQIAVRPAGAGAFTSLAPRQPITSGPYAIRSLNSTTADTATNSLNLGGVAASQFVVTNDSRMTDPRAPLPGSANYIQNQNSGPQSTSNFSISGNGTAGGTLSGNVVNAALQFNISGNRVLSVAGTQNVFVGQSAGNANTSGANNSFFGQSSGFANTTGANNSFFGRGAGDLTTTGNSNAFFGASSGTNNVSGFANTLLGTNAEVTASDLQFATAIGANASVAMSNTIALGRPAGQDTVKIPGILDVASQYFIGGIRLVSVAGDNNLFVGRGAGAANVVGQSNSYFGSNAGLNNDGFHNSFFGSSAGRQTTSGLGNSFFGSSAGEQNVDGERNAFFGYLAGSSNTTGDRNAFFGSDSGDANTTANDNAFFGAQSGRSTTTGGSNTFVGTYAGLDNLTGSNNAFFGKDAGGNNLVSQNSFFGALSGRLNSTGAENSFFGYRSGDTNSTGSENSFFGYQAGFLNTSGDSNTFVGREAGYANTTSGGNSFFGEQAGFANTGGANSFFGAHAGFSNTTGILNAFFGHSTGDLNTIGSSNSFFGKDAGGVNSTGMQNVFVGAFAGNTNTSGDNNTVIGYNADVTSGDLQYATAIGAGATAGSNNQIVLGRNSGADVVAIPGHLFINNSGAATTALSVGGRGTFFGDLATTGKFDVSDLGTAGSQDICRNNVQELSTCSSSLRYKSDVRPFFGGLDVVRRLQPISFRWTDGNSFDLGFGAEDVEKVEPLLVTRNASGAIEGVKYKQITTVLVNAVNDQQAQIQAQQLEIAEQKAANQKQQKQIDELRIVVCSLRADAAICSQEEK